jgi:hypothetical protein
MSLRLPMMTVLCLLATIPLGAKIFSPNTDLIWWEAETPQYESFKLSAAAKSSDYQNELTAKLQRWLGSEELSTFGPLTLGLILLFLPVGFSRARVNSPDAQQQQDEGSNLRRIGRSWDPRF